MPQPARHRHARPAQGGLAQRHLLHLPRGEARPVPLEPPAGGRELRELPRSSRLELRGAAEARRGRGSASSATRSRATPRGRTAGTAAPRNSWWDGRATTATRSSTAPIIQPASGSQGRGPPMRKPGTARFLFAALAILASANVASAQTKTETQIGGWNVEGYIEPGLRFFLENPNGERTPGLADGKFEEYRDINQGLYLEGLRLRFFRPDEAYSFQISGKDWGLHTQEFHLLGERLGQWQAGFDWDQMRHVYSTTSQSLYKEFGGNIFKLPTVRPTPASWNSAPPWGCTPHRSVPAAMTATARSPSSGTRGACSSSSRRHPTWTSWPSTHGSTRTASAPSGWRSAALAGLRRAGPAHRPDHPRVQDAGDLGPEMAQLQWGYTASVFVDGFNWVRADNPCNPGAPPPCPAVGNRRSSAPRRCRRTTRPIPSTLRAVSTCRSARA